MLTCKLRILETPPPSLSRREKSENKRFANDLKKSTRGTIHEKEKKNNDTYRLTRYFNFVIAGERVPENPLEARLLQVDALTNKIPVNCKAGWADRCD